MVSGGQQRDSAIHIQASILPQTPLPARLPHNTQQAPVLCSGSLLDNTFTSYPTPCHSPWEESSAVLVSSHHALFMNTQALSLRTTFLYWEGFPGVSEGKGSACSVRESGSIPGLGRPPRKGNGTSVLLPGEFHGHYSPWGCKESDMTERLTLSYTRSFWRQMETWLGQWDSQDRALFLGLDPVGKWEEDGNLMFESAVRHFQGCCRQRPRGRMYAGAQTSSPNPGFASWAHKWAEKRTDTVDTIYWRQGLQTQRRHRGPHAWLCARVSWTSHSPVSWADSTESTWESGFFFNKDFWGGCFCCCLCSYAGSSSQCRTSLHPAGYFSFFF